MKASWLTAHRDDADLLIVDCRFVLGDPGGGRRLFEASRLPGASFLDVDADLAAPPAAAGHAGPVGGRHPLPARADLESALRTAGISADTHVVAYDQAMNGGAARLWWVLRHHGFTRCSVLDGGFAAWDGPIEEGEPRPQAIGGVILTDGRDDIVDAAAVERGGATVLDARAAERYAGEVEPVDPVAGHIPGARNVPFGSASSIDEDLLAHPGPLVAYCGSGVTACVLLLGFAAAGRNDVLLYPGSWSDWVARGGAVETGPDRGAAC